MRPFIFLCKISRFFSEIFRITMSRRGNVTVTSHRDFVGKNLIPPDVDVKSLWRGYEVVLAIFDPVCVLALWPLCEFTGWLSCDKYEILKITHRVAWPDFTRNQSDLTGSDFIYVSKIQILHQVSTRFYENPADLIVPVGVLSFSLLVENLLETCIRSRHQELKENVSGSTPLNEIF